MLHFRPSPPPHTINSLSIVIPWLLWMLRPHARRSGICDRVAIFSPPFSVDHSSRVIRRLTVPPLASLNSTRGYEVGSFFSPLTALSVLDLNSRTVPCEPFYGDEFGWRLCDDDREMRRGCASCPSPTSSLIFGLASQYKKPKLQKKSRVELIDRNIHSSTQSIPRDKIIHTVPRGHLPKKDFWAVSPETRARDATHTRIANSISVMILWFNNRL